MAVIEFESQQVIYFSDMFYSERNQQCLKPLRVFWSGRSQAVRLPLEFRFNVPEVRIRKQGASVILEPIPCDWSWLDTVGSLDEDAVEFATEQATAQRRPALDELFK